MQLPEFNNAHVLVFGDVMLDRYWHGATSRISPEAPVPVVHVDTIEERAGGAGNVALNIAALGVETTLLGFCGRDEAGASLKAALSAVGVHALLEPLAECKTITKLRVISRHQQLIRLDFEDDFYSVSSTALMDQFSSLLERVDVVVLSDYGKGTLQAVEQLIELARRADKPVLIDPKGNDFSIYHGATVITPNFSEFEAVVGRCGNDQQIVDRGMALLQQQALEALLVTRGEQGMTLLTRTEPPLHLPTRARDVYDVTGAGDTVISVLAAALAAGKALSDATALANLAAGLVVGKLGTASITSEELGDAQCGLPSHHRGVAGLEQLLERLNGARKAGEKIVATNGCFDILHPGHIHYLQQARELGDRLVVLVNSDDSVRRLKGNDRPVNPLSARMTMLAALESVDWVIPFGDDTPRDLICQILPDILVKGGDYADVTQIAGYDCVVANGGEVKVLGFVDGFSTSNLIRSIKGDESTRDE